MVSRQHTTLASADWTQRRNHKRLIPLNSFSVRLSGILSDPRGPHMIEINLAQATGGGAGLAAAGNGHHSRAVRTSALGGMYPAAIDAAPGFVLAGLIGFKDLFSFDLYVSGVHAFYVSDVRTSEVRAFELCACEVRALEPCRGEVRASEVRIFELCASEVCASEVRVFEVRACEVRISEVRACEVRALEPCRGEVRAFEPCVSEVRAFEPCVSESLLQNDLMFFKPLRDSVSCA